MRFDISRTAAASDTVTELVNCTLHIDADRVIEHAFIRFGDKIVCLGGMDERPDGAADRTMDLQGAHVYPGFIDAHCHLGMWEDGLGFEGDDGNETTDPATPQLRAIDAINGSDRCFDEAVRAGVTTVVTGPGSANAIGGQLACIKTRPGVLDTRIVKAPVAMKMALGENPKTSYNDRDETPITRMATAAIIREQLMIARRYSENTDSAEEPSERPDFDAKADALLPVIRGELPVHIHAHRADDIFTAIRIANEFDLDMVIVHATEGHLCAKELAAMDVPVMSGPLFSDRSKPELRNHTPATAGALANAGVRNAIVSDHPVVPVQYLAASAALAVREGMSRRDALAAITSVPAQLTGVFDRVGSLDVGKDADMCVFDCDPISLEAKPRMVFIDGLKMEV